MTPVSRRLFWYWLLLLLPTLAAAVGALELLQRERSRLAQQEASAAEARRAAAANRAGLIVENIELLVGDVQAALLDSLAAMPAGDVDAGLAAWERAHPLVRAAFRCTPDGRLLYPSAEADGDAARGFRRRFQSMLAESPPWAAGALPVAGAAAVYSPRKEVQQLARAPRESAPSDPAVYADLAATERSVHDRAASNVAQLQSARRDVQALSKVREHLAEAAAAPAAAASVSADEMRPAGRAEPAREAVPVRSGWAPWLVDGRLHLLGWLEQPFRGEVRGVEIELAALIARLGPALPVEVSAGEGFALRDDRGRTLHQVGWVPGGAEAPALSLPVASVVFPGWTVVAYLDAPVRPDGAGAGFFLVGLLLTGILVVAILAGGALLWGQARRSEAEAVQKTSFVANVSHEFKTPLTTIRLYAELLEQGRVPEPARQRDYLQTIGRETQRLARLVGNALDFSRLEQGRKQYAREPLDLSAELRRLLDTHAPRLAEAGLRLEGEIPAGVVAVTTDRDAVDQIVLNLLDNAVKYAAGGGEVTVALRARAPGGAEVHVRDRGPGVPAAHRERIFDKFHRVDETLTAGPGGAGLGLSIARQLARGLGGDLRFEPRDGGGATFVLELP